MPISRYQIRNEYSLADPELYKAADKDDPEALLEGVAMAGLVGVLRQLGDLAEFAAEVFHDLHEEVIATSARGHSLMGRVQQLEADFPSIEKAFLSQTNHSSFFYNGGIDWHPNMRMDQNLITRGDLPRFIMDSYEECRGPPRLFLLDKFDVAGAGACLKRYTDPSFFKVEGSGLGITDADVQREKRTRKGKKRGSRWSNGETPEVLQTSHAKLHQLLLEERIENNNSDPARRVKLKRRLNGFPFNLKTGGSYMEKFLNIPSPEQKVVREISISSSPLRLPANNTYESGIDIRSESPDKKFRRRSLSPAPDMERTLQNFSVDKLNGGVSFDNGIYEVPKANRSFEGDNVLSVFHEEVGEKEIAVDGESKTECSIDDYQSDGVASEVDDYVDALATMESEMDTDSELRAKSDLHALSNKRRISGYDGNEAEHQAPSSDSQSTGSSMLSDDGNSSSKKQISSSSYSDSRSISAENIPLEGVVSAKGLSDKIHEDRGTAIPLKQECGNEDIGVAPSAEHANNDGSTKVAEIPMYRSDHSEQTLPNLSILPPTLVQVHADSTMRDHVMVEGETKVILCAHNAPETELINDTGSETNLIVSVLGDSRTSDAPLRSENDSSPRVSAENWAVTGLDDKYLNKDESFSTGLSEIPWHSRDASLVADSSKSQRLEDLKTEENYSSLSPTYQPLDELGDDSSNLTEDRPEISPEELPVNRLDNEDSISISDASDDNLHVLDASANIPNVIYIGQEDEKSNNSRGSISQTENAEDDMGNEANNHIGLPISNFPDAEEESPKWSFPELETHKTVEESDHIFPSPDDVIFPAVEEQSLEEILPELDTHDTLMESGQIVLVPDDVILPATEEQSLEQSVPELDSHDTDVASDHVVTIPDDVTPPAAEIVAVVSSPKDSTIDVDSEDLHNPEITDDVHPLDLAENQLDMPIPVISHLEEEDFERSVMESSKDAISNGLHNSGIPDKIQPPDPAIESTGDQIDSPIPVLPHLDEQSLDLTTSILETDGKGAAPDDIIFDLNNMMQPAGEIAVDTEPRIESSNICDLKMLQASVEKDDVPQLDSAELGILYNGEQNLHELPRLEEGEEMDEVIRCTDLVERDAASNFMISAVDKPLTRNADVNDADADADADVNDADADVDVNDADAESNDADTVPSAGFDDNAKACDVTLSDFKKLDEESLSNFEEPNQSQTEAEVSVQDIYTKSDVLTELSLPKVASLPALASDLSDTLHHDLTEAEVPDSSSQVESSSDLGNVVTTSSPLQQSGLGTNALTSQESNLSDNCEEISSFPIHHDVEEHGVKSSPDELEKVETSTLQNVAPANLEPIPQLEQKGSLDGCYNSASGSLLVNLSSQPSVSKLVPQDNCSIVDIGRPKAPFSSSTVFGLLPEANINLEDMPPLPPLPPVQWRMGKQQHASLVQEKEALPSNVFAFPSFSMSRTDQKAQPSNQFLSHYDMAGESTHLVDGYVSHYPVSDGPFLSQVPPMVHHESNTNSLPPLGETRYVDQVLPLPEKFEEMLQNDSRDGEKDLVQPSLTSFPQVTNAGTASTHASSLPDDEANQLHHHESNTNSLLPLGEARSIDQVLPLPEKFDEMLQSDAHIGEKDVVEPSLTSFPQVISADTASTHASSHPNDEANQLHHQNNPETSSKDKKPDQGTVPSDGTIIIGEDVLQPKIDNEQPQNMIFSPIGEIAWPSQDDGKANGGRTTKLPRPRNPLIDAVIANDQSKLRKVSERPRPQIEKVDERDSLLEQIRTKSFNLKPAVASRPTIQGPTTNLRVAAILEKAKTIRMAFAGSDEDDDDSWSE